FSCPPVPACACADRRTAPKTSTRQPAVGSQPGKRCLTGHLGFPDQFRGDLRRRDGYNDNAARGYRQPLPPHPLPETERGGKTAVSRFRGRGGTTTSHLLLPLYASGRGGGGGALP